MALTYYKRLERHNAKKKDIRDKANKIVSEKIRRIVKRDKIFYNGLFAYPVIKAFAKKEGIGFTQVIAIMLMDLYPIFTYKDAKLWGFDRVYFFELVITLREKGYIFSQRSRYRTFYPTLKGKTMIKEFNKYYDDHVKEVFKSLGEEDKGTIRKITRVQPARIYKPRDQSTSDKPASNSKRTKPQNTD